MTNPYPRLFYIHAALDLHKGPDLDINELTDNQTGRRRVAAGFAGSWNWRGSDVELTWIRCGTEWTVCGRAASSVGRDVETVDETPDPRRAT